MRWGFDRDKQTAALPFVYCRPVIIIIMDHKGVWS